MDQQLLRFFVTTADAGSLSAAAVQLGYAQSNLSTRIAQLEQELGETLFYRYKRGVKLTSKGDIFYTYARKILSLSEEAAYAVQDQDTPRGKLALGSLEATAFQDLPSLLSGYNQRYPAVTLSLEIDLNDFLPDKVLRHDLDGAFVLSPVQDPTLVQVPFRNDQLVLVGSSTLGDLDTPELLRTAKLLSFPEGSAFRQRLEFLLTNLEIPYYDRLIVTNSLGAMVANICAGLGISYLPRTLVQPYLDQGLLRQYPYDTPISALDIVFIYRRDHIQDAAFRYFLDMLTARNQNSD